MKITYILILFLSIISCKQRVVDNTSEFTFGASFNKIKNSLNKGDNIEFELACLAVFLDNMSSKDNVESFDIDDLQVRVDFRILFAGKTARDIVNEADKLMEQNHELEMQIKMLEIGIRGRELGIFE